MRSSAQSCADIRQAGEPKINLPLDPFGKRLEEIDEADLQQLVSKRVTEGFYFEFKSIPPSSDKIGHGIAALANTYGGWYILGVVTDAHNVATAVPGFDPALMHDPTSTIREVVKSHVDPLPLFFIHVVILAGGRLVAVVQVPGDQDSPFITRDGRLYRRAADSSDPVFETSRYALDRLYDRTAKARERFATFCTDERTFAKGESEQAWVKLFFAPYPAGTISRPEILASDGITQLIKSTRDSRVLMRIKDDAVSGNSPLDNAFPTPDSVVLQPRSTVIYNGLTVELFVDGRCRILIRVEWRAILRRDLDNLEPEKVKRVLLQRFGTDETHEMPALRFVDLGRLWLTIAIHVTWYLDWLSQDADVSAIDFALHLTEVWRHVPFGQTDEWADYVEQFGLPVLRSSEIAWPRERGMRFRFDVRPDEQPWMVIAGQVGQAFGITIEAGSHLVAHAVAQAAQKTPKSGAN